jgi:hypothetical protein
MKLVFIICFNFKKKGVVHDRLSIPRLPSQTGCTLHVPPEGSDRLPVRNHYPCEPAGSRWATQPREFNIPAQPLKTALDAFAQQSAFQMLYTVDTVEGLRSNPIQGVYPPEQALKLLLEEQEPPFIGPMNTPSPS